MVRPRFRSALFACALAAATVPAPADAATNAADNERTGWYPNQPTLTPALVSGGTFGQLFVTGVTGQVYVQPLVANGVLFVATEANWIYGLNPETGAILWSRSLGTPWNASDLSCGDLVPTIGITGTPVIDEAAGTAYFLKKTYVSGSSGPAAWYMHAIDVTTGNELSGFPVQIQGNAQNNPGQAFNATKEHQRPGLLLMDGVVYAAFGAHCDVSPWQGWVVGVSTAGQIKALWVDMAGVNQSGAGIWQSGGGIVSDGSGRIIVATGNGGSPTVPTPGTSPPASLGESIVRLQVQANGTLQAVDFFAPFDAFNLDSWDADFASGGPMSLPSAYFGTPTIPKLLVEVGKEGYVYLLNRDSLGGFKQGPGAGDDVVARIGPYGGVWSRATAWPGDGGYVYIPTASGGNSASGSSGFFRYYKYGLDVNGKPTLALVATSSDDFGFTSSSAVVTSDGTTSGSALVWIIWTPSGSGSGASLRCYDPLPVNGLPHLRWSAPVGTSSKFNPPGVGPNGRIYVGTRAGQVYGFGAPISPPLSGATLDFPGTIVGQSATLDDVLTVNQATTVSAVSTTDPQFTTGTITPPLPATLSPGQTLTVSVTFTPTHTGPVGGALVVTETQGTQQFGLQGTGIANGPLLTATPVAVSFGGTTVGGHLASAVIYSNQGSQPLTITNTTLPAAPFSASGVPPLGYLMNPGDSVTVNVFFDPTIDGYFTDDIALDSTGGLVSVPLSGTATLPSVLVITPLSLTYGNVSIGSSKSLSFTVQNSGTSTVTITKSKPPVGGQYTNLTNLFEGSTLAPGQSVTETVQFTPTKLGYQTDRWTINSDAGGGVRDVTFNGVGAIPDPVSGGWTVNTSASIAAPLLVLTPNSQNRAGSAFWPVAVDASNLRADFYSTIDQGTGADGMTLAITDPARGARPTSLGANGASLGFSLIPGIAVALDTFQNDFDPSSNFVGVTDGPVSTSNPDALHWLATSTAIPALRLVQRHINVQINGGTMSVAVDGAPVISTPVTLGATAYIGFTGGTGSLTDRHAVSSVTIDGVPSGPAITATAVPASGTIHLSWTGGAAPYTLQRALDPGFTVGVVTLTSGSATSFDDPVLNDSVAYYYRVQ